MDDPGFIEVRIKGLTKFGWIKEMQSSWLELDAENGPNIRIIFPDDFPSEFKLRLQEIQSHVSDERRKLGMPVIERSFDTEIQGWEYGYDPVNELATITTRFQNGARQSTFFPRNEIPKAIAQLRRAQEEIEKNNNSQAH